MHAELYNKHTFLLDVEIENGYVTKINSMINRDLLPVIVSYAVSLDSINTWLMKRYIPKKREGLEETKRLFGEFPKYTHMFSLSDQYWFKTGPDDTWEDLNFFTNRYSPVIGNLFFEPWSADTEGITELSPDLTTNGVLRKRWVQDEHLTSYLIKAGSVKYHQEPISEVLASMTLQQLKIIEFVEYRLVVDGMKLCSKCRNFIDQDSEFIPASHIYSKYERKDSETVYTHLIRTCNQFGITGAKESIDNMIVADRIIGNTDRHLGNFGFIRDVRSGRISGFAPLFDSGSAFWNSAKATRSKKNLFADREEAAMENVRKYMSLDRKLETGEMYHLINMYPNISRSKKQEIQWCIEQAQKNLRKEAERPGQSKELPIGGR